MLVTGHNLPINWRVITLVLEKILEADVREVAVEGRDESVFGSVDSSSRVAAALAELSLQWDRQQHNINSDDTLPHVLLDTRDVP